MTAYSNAVWLAAELARNAGPPLTTVCNLVRATGDFRGYRDGYLALGYRRGGAVPL